MIHKTIILTVILFSQLVSQDNYTEWVQEQNIPIEVRKLFKANKLNQDYSFSFHINPFYLRGDFDSNGEPDFVILIKELKTNKIGIAIIHPNLSDIYILGAGKKFGNGGDDFKWMNIWRVYRKNIKEDNKKIDAIYVEKAESASGLILWMNNKYIWEQHSD